MIKKTIIKLTKYAYTFKLYIYYLIYSFDKWHVFNNKHTISYKKIVERKLTYNNKINSIIEIGCGLGELFANSKKKYFGYDICPKVINAAKALHRNSNFKIGGLEITPTKIDLFITVNWIHNMPIAELINLLKPHLENSRFYLFDVILPNTNGYLYKHNDLMEYFPSFKLIQIIYEDHKRQILLYEKS